MTDSYIYALVALLPLAALMLVFQVNPYHALVIRAILGAVAALVYTVLGAADVALTEALVGTMLAVTLYIVAVRSSLVMRLGILEESKAEREGYFAEIIANLKKILDKYYLRLELVKYPNPQALEQALIAKEVHATYSHQEETERIAIRVSRLFEIMQTELISAETILTYVTVPTQEDNH